MNLFTPLFGFLQVNPGANVINIFWTGVAKLC